MKVIIHNDDFGLTYGFTEAIRDSYLAGITTSTSIRVNGTAISLAIRYLKNDLSKIGKGIHLNVTDGPAFEKKLCNYDGDYKYNYIQYIVLAKRNRYLLETIEKDFEKQIETVVDSGIKIDHIDSQEHVHMIPGIFEIACKLAQKYKIPAIRFSNEPIYTKPASVPNLAKFALLKTFCRINAQKLKKSNLVTTRYFYGILHTDNMSEKEFQKCLFHGASHGIKTAEILGHPAYSTDKRDKKFTSSSIYNYVMSSNRKTETKTFQSLKIKAFLDKMGVDQITFRNL